MKAIEAVEREHLVKRPAMRAGDTVRVHVKVREGDKERIQVFEGMVIGQHRGGANATFTVRKVSFGQGVERIFPLHSPWIDMIKVRRLGKARRAKLYYLRGRVGKATKVREKMAFEKTHSRKHREEGGAPDVPESVSDRNAEPKEAEAVPNAK